MASACFVFVKVRWKRMEETERKWYDNGKTTEPRSNKWYFLNGVPQSGVFRWWSGFAWQEGATKMLENTGVFNHSLSL